MLRRLRPALFVLLIAPLSPAQSTWFPFTLPWDDASKTVVDASDLLIDYPGQDPATVVDARGHLRAGSDGHFYFENTGRRARFWGVNFTFNANFPTCPDEPLRAGEFPDDRVSEKVARRLAKLGVNVVRFHHVDTSVSPNGIWDRQYYPNDTQHLDPGQLRRLDHLVYQLRKNGIYVNINLKVGRHFGPGDGILDSRLFTGSLSYFQGVSHFNQRMIELQQDYARQLLTHRNPYTGKTYAEDPAVIFVEIANEDSLFGNLYLDTLNYVPDVSGSLPERYSRELDTLWNEWLARRYLSREALDAAWKSHETVVDTSNKIRNGGFENGMSEWTVQQLGSARAAGRVESNAGPDGSAALRVDVTSDGTNWHVQAFQQGHAIEANKTYEFAFYARASNPGELTVDIMKGVAPWSNFGLSKTFRLSTTWQRFTGRFQANDTDSSTVRPTFELGARDNTIWIDQVEFRSSVPKGLESDESLAAGTVRRPVRADLGSYTPARIIDLFRFYTEVDEDYFVGMQRYLKEDLGVKALVTGTAPWWTYLGDTATQAKLDFVDGHYYWDHPSWPPGQEWAPTGWKITNQPFINQLQNLAGLAAQAVEGRPYTVSEFNEVFPNRYALEGPLLVAMIANLQDWDAVYMFDYAGSTASFDDTFTSSFFSHAGNPIKTAQLPICSRIFLSRQSSSASESVSVELTREELARGFAKGVVNGSSLLASKGLDRRAFLKARQRIRTFDRTEPTNIDYPVTAGSVTSSNEELIWNTENDQAAYLRVKGSAVQGAIGFVKGSTLDLGDWSFRVGDAGPSHMAVLLQSRDAAPLRETRRMILSIWTEHQNSEMGWNDTQTSVDNRWGHAPTIVRPAQIDLTLRFPSAPSIQLYPLDEIGNRKPALTGQVADKVSQFQLDTGRDQTVWYEIEINDEAAIADFTVPAAGPFQLFTDGSARELRAGWFEVENRAGAALRATALLEYSTRGILTSAGRLPVSSPMALARTPVIRNSRLDTAVALLNKQPAANTIVMRLLDTSGTSQGNEKLERLQPGEARAFFVRERFSVSENFEGLLELSSASQFYALTLRSTINSAGDFSLTPYPAESTSAGPLYFAHLAADGAYSSDILLWNSQSQPVSARVEFFSPQGVATTAGGQPALAEVSLSPGQLKRIGLPRAATAFYGYARITLMSGAALPSITAVITRWESGGPVSEAGVPATSALGEDLLLVAERANQRTALALVNPGTGTATVDLELLSSEIPAPGTGKAQIRLQSGEKRAFFLYEIFPKLPTYFTGSLRVKSASNVATLALLGITNARDNFLLAAVTGEAALAPISPGSVAVVPRFATGAGYRTILYLLPDKAGTAGSQGRIRFYDTTGAPQALLFR